MKRLTFLIISILFCSLSFGAEFLIMAHNGSAYKMGDIVVEKNDGWQWGNMEVHPDYFVIKVPTLNDNTDYSVSSSTNSRRYSVGTAIVAANAVNNTVTITTTTFYGHVFDKGL